MAESHRMGPAVSYVEKYDHRTRGDYITGAVWDIGVLKGDKRYDYSEDERWDV